MATGYRLNISIVLAAVYRLSGLFRAVSAVEPSLCRHFPSLRRPNPLPLTNVRVALWGPATSLKSLKLSVNTAPKITDHLGQLWGPATSLKSLKVSVNTAPKITDHLGQLWGPATSLKSLKVSVNTAPKITDHLGQLWGPATSLKSLKLSVNTAAK